MRVCEIEGCGRKHHARRMCSMHYIRWNEGYTGTLLDVPPERPQMSVDEWAQIDAAAEKVARQKFLVAMVWLTLTGDNLSKRP